MSARIRFLGGVGTVTGSKYLVEGNRSRVLVDCGLFQGVKSLRARNWAPFPVDEKSIDALLLTHAHLDHSGYIPRLVKQGFRGPVVSTEASRDLCDVLLSDSGYLLEQDAEYANRHGFSKHRPALPLYTQEDAKACMAQFSPVRFRDTYRIKESMSARFLPGGHILGASIVELSCAGTKVVFSGDLGRRGSATMVDPAQVDQADYLIVESTYGNRLHETSDPEDVLADTISRTAGRGGTVIIPSFAVGRAQSILFHLHRLKSDGRIPDLPVFLDSPMAINASEIFCKHLSDHRLTEEECRRSCDVAQYVRDRDESKALDQEPMPKIIVSASGMATGGRILHHLKHYAPDHRNTILFAGFQAAGTRGAAMTGGARSVKIHGRRVPVRAEVANLHMLSAHADADEILGWLRGFKAPPKKTFITHGEPEASDSLRRRIEDELRWTCHIPEMNEEIELA